MTFIINKYRPVTWIKLYAQTMRITQIVLKFLSCFFSICQCNIFTFDATEVATKNDNVAVDLSGLLEGIPGPHFYRQNQGYFDYLGMWLRYMNRWDKFLSCFFSICQCNIFTFDA